jgi:hypothetical protein
VDCGTATSSKDGADIAGVDAVDHLTGEPCLKSCALAPSQCAVVPVEEKLGGAVRCERPLERLLKLRSLTCLFDFGEINASHDNSRGTKRGGESADEMSLSDSGGKSKEEPIALQETYRDILDPALDSGMHDFTTRVHRLPP